MALFGGAPQPEERYVGGLGIFLYGCLLVLLGALLFSAVFEVWPAVEDSTAAAAGFPEPVVLFWGLVDLTLTKDTALILFVLLTGALGGYVHATTSFTSYVGNRTLKTSWLWWYSLRLLVGAGMALGFYFVVAAGLFNAQDSSEEINAYGTGAFSFLVGLFSKQAIDKLEEIFNTAFGVEEGDAGRKDKLEDRRPVIHELDPGEVRVGEGAEITIQGQRFKRDARVRFGQRLREATVNSEEELVVKVPREVLEKPARIRVAVINPEPDDEQSNVKQLRVVAE